MKVMFADDDGDLRKVVERVMLEDGFEFCGAKDGLEVLDRIDAERPDVIILDISMPYMDGFETCLRLRERGVRTPIIFLSARSDIVDKSVGFRAGCDDYLTKPFSPLELSLRVEALIRRCASNTDAPVLSDAETAHAAGAKEATPSRRSATSKSIWMDTRSSSRVSPSSSHPKSSRSSRCSFPRPARFLRASRSSIISGERVSVWICATLRCSFARYVRRWSPYLPSPATS